MKTILVVEDDRTIAKALGIRMKSAGYQAVEAYDAVSAVSMARKHSPDLVLLDINMPAGDGFLVAERIHTMLPYKVPIVFLTAANQPGFREKAMALGAAAYIQKPYESKILLATIKNALEEQAED